MGSPSIISCKDNIIKYSTNNITFFENEYVYKQFLFNKFRWINELINVNNLNHPNIIKFKKCEIVNDYIVDINNKEILLDKQEKVVRITMNKYMNNLNNLKNFTDDEVFFILNKLISAITYCHSKNILHRDIKESNIFINYKYKKTLLSKTRIINDIVLADFNISKYKYNIQSINKFNIMTISHRSPEISKAIFDKKHLNYDERIDMWSFCIMLSFLITGKTFYSFLTDGYLLIDNKILYDADKMAIVMAHFLKVYNPKLKYVDLYKKIIFMGLTKYKVRASFDDIIQVINEYIIINNLKYKIYENSYSISSPEQVFNPKLISNLALIKNLHNVSQYNTIVIVTFFKFYNKMKIHKFEFNNINTIALYTLSALFLIEEIPNIIDNILNILTNQTLMEEKINKSLIELEIINIIKFNNYNLF